MTSIKGDVAIHAESVIAIISLRKFGRDSLKKGVIICGPYIKENVAKKDNIAPGLKIVKGLKLQKKRISLAAGLCIALSVDLWI